MNLSEEDRTELGRILCRTRRRLAREAEIRPRLKRILLRECERIAELEREVSLVEIPDFSSIVGDTLQARLDYANAHRAGSGGAS